MSGFSLQDGDGLEIHGALPRLGRWTVSEETTPITVVLATDSFLIGDGLACLMSNVPDMSVVGRARDHDQMLSMIEELNPDVAIISIRTPVITTNATIETAKALRLHHPTLGVVVVSDQGNNLAMELLWGGSSHVAYLLDESLTHVNNLLAAVRAVHFGQTVLDPAVVGSLIRRRDVEHIDELTLRETDVLERMARGMTNRAIARDLNLSIKAIESNATIIFRKLQLTQETEVDRRVGATLAYLRAYTGPFQTVLERKDDPEEGR